MADDRTPRNISLTESAPDENLPKARKREKDAEGRKSGLDHDAVMASERKAAEQGAEERPGSRLN